MKSVSIDEAMKVSPEHVELLDKLKDQLLIIFLKRLGNELTLSVNEIDDTGNDLFLFSFDAAEKTFHFEVRKKVKASPDSTG